MTKATIDTDKGAIEIELSTKGAPKATANFIELAGKGFYDGVVFHRLVHQDSANWYCSCTFCAA